MADDSDTKAKAASIVSQMDVGAIGRPQVGGRRAKYVPLPGRIQTISDGQWRNPTSMQQVEVDDFDPTNTLLVVGPLHGVPEGRVPTDREMADATRKAKADKAKAERDKAKALRDAMIARNPERGFLRRPHIDMSVCSAPKAVPAKPQPKTIHPKVAPARVKPKPKPVPPWRKP